MMPRQSLEFRVVIAPPSDVYDTRKAAFEAIRELNRTLEIQNVTLRAIGWEEYGSPGIDTDAQHVINKQILQEYDILIAIFGTTLGTPTKSERSGTVEEIEHAISKTDSEIGMHRVQIYFCDKIDSLSHVSIDELKRLEEYRNSLSERGVLYRKFKTDDELQREVRVNLQRPISDYLQKNGGSQSLMVLKKDSVVATESQHDEKASLDQSPKLNTTEDLGILDYQEKGEFAIAAANVSIEAMSGLLSEINEETKRNVLEVERISSPLISAVDKKKVINSFAEFLKSRASQLKQEAASAKSNFVDFFDSLVFIVEISREFGDPIARKKAVDMFLVQADRILQTSPKTREGVISFKQTIQSIPRITIQFNQAKKLLIDALDDCIHVFEDVEDTIKTTSAKLRFD